MKMDKKMKFQASDFGFHLLLGFCLLGYDGSVSNLKAATIPEVVASASLESIDVEPSYCDPALFDETEIPLGLNGYWERPGLVRAHAFRLGKVTLVGLGVGDSKVKDVVELSQRLAPGRKLPKDCTFYFNHPKSEKDWNRKKAADTFVHLDIDKNPMAMTEEEASLVFMKILSSSFDQDAVSFVSCASEQKYLALGCNEMMHRGPTVFGMILAFSGCTPAHALEIVDQTWGLNNVKRKVRLAVINKAYQLGQTRKESRKRLSEAFLSK
jgi:hypothetical protein